MPTLQAASLSQFARDILGGAGVPADKAGVVAESLVAANLRGVDSHGVQLLPFYVDKLLAGEVDANADGEVVSQSGACAVFDGRNGLGQWIARQCCERASRMAAETGLGLVVARESNHFGAAAFWASRLRDAGAIGIVMCNASPIVPPWQGCQGRVGTNPIAIAVPGPWLLDMATTTVAAGRIFKAMINHQPEIPAGWAFDAAGVPTTSTAAAFGGMLMPLGGYKGSGLGMAAEILCAVLGGGAMALDVSGVRERRRSRVSQMFLAIDVAHFMPVAELTARVESLVAIIKSAPPAPGYNEVLVAGDPEWRTEAERREHGIPIPDGNWDLMVKAAARVGAALPDGLQ